MRLPSGVIATEVGSSPVSIGLPTTNGFGAVFTSIPIGDMIKSAGYRIGPFEIESALLKHPSVAEAAVVGKKDALRGEIVKGFVVLRPGIVGTDELAHELTTFVKQAVGGHQAPRALEFVDDLPKTETGKIQRFALRERA